MFLMGGIRPGYFFSGAGLRGGDLFDRAKLIMIHTKYVVRIILK